MAIHEMVDMGDASNGSTEKEDVNEDQNNEHHDDILMNGSFLDKKK
jgi:hypothetical protein